MIRRFSLSFFAVSFLLLTVAASAVQRRVPDNYGTIQAAVNASAHGDKIVIGVGTYHERVEISKGVILTSSNPNDPSIVANTIIDAGGSGSAIKFSETVSTDGEIRGLTFAGGDRAGLTVNSGTLTISNCIFRDNVNYSGSGKGGGIYNGSAHLTVIDSLFIRNTASGYGGGIFSSEGVLTVIGCEFIQNWAQHEGGGIGTDYEEVTVQDCLFIENEANYGGGLNSSHYGATVTNCTFAFNWARIGGGICEKELYLNDKTVRIKNCTFYDNLADEYGGGVAVRNSGNMIMSNCILWDNIAFMEGPQISTGRAGDNGNDGISISYCCIQGGQGDIYKPKVTLNWGLGNFDADPLFADAWDDDFHLQSVAGRWDADQERWVVDHDHSPGIDTGDPASDWTAETWPNGQRINMGAFGGTAQASKSQTTGGNTILTISSTTGGSVNTPGEGSFEYAHGNLVAIEAAADADYRFVSWTGTAVDAGKVAEPLLANTSVTMDDNYSLQANFEPVVPDVVGMTISSTIGGSVNIPGEGLFEYAPGELVAIEATAEVDYRFVSWTGTAVDAGKVAEPLLANTSVTMDDNYSLQANFQPVVPDVVGMTQTNAEATIAAIDSLTVSVSTTYSDTVAAGVVLSQDPVGGTAVPAGSTVSIVVSQGNIADIDASGSVDGNDFILLTGAWLSTADSLREDLNGDGIVNFKDFAVFLDNWDGSEFPPMAGNIADIDSSGSVDETDLWLLTGAWLSTEDSLPENLNGDGIVNLKDFAVFADNWGWKQ